MAKRPSVLKSARLIGICTLVSRVLGMVRDVLCSHIFGAGMFWDAFTIAYRIPNLFRRLFGEGALPGAFVPSFVRLLDGGRREEAFALVNRLLTLLIVFLGAVTVAGIAVSFVLPLFWPDEKMRVVMELTRILLPYVLLVCTGAIIGSALHGLFKFFAPAFAPIVLNVTWIAALPFFAFGVPEDRAIRAVAWSIIVAGVLQLLTMAIPLARQGVRFRFDWAPRDQELRDVGRQFLPMVFGLALVQINELVDSLIAEIFVPGHGAVSALYYSTLLTQFPSALIGTSLATAILPGLSSAAAQGDRERFSGLLGRAISAALYFSLPAAAGLVLFGTDIVAVLFEHGRFTPEDTARTGLAASLFGAGLWCFCVNQVQVRAFHAHRDTRTPVRVSGAMVALNLVLNLVLVGPMREAGLALATSITGLATFLILNLLLRRRHGDIDLGRVRKDFLRSLAATAVMGVVAWAFVKGVGPWLPVFGTSAIGTRALPLGIAIVLSMAVYFGLTRLMGMKDAISLVRRRP